MCVGVPVDPAAIHRYITIIIETAMIPGYLVLVSDMAVMVDLFQQTQATLLVRLLLLPHPPLLLLKLLPKLLLLKLPKLLPHLLLLADSPEECLAHPDMGIIVIRTWAMAI